VCMPFTLAFLAFPSWVAYQLRNRMGIAAGFARNFCEKLEICARCIFVVRCFCFSERSE